MTENPINSTDTSEVSQIRETAIKEFVELCNKKNEKAKVKLIGKNDVLRLGFELSTALIKEALEEMMEGTK